MRRCQRCCRCRRPRSTPTPASSNLAWTFSSTPEAFDYLDDGETLTLTYTVRATDDSTAFDDQTVTITITGTNDAPVITVVGGDSAAETLAETDVGAERRGTLTVVDADLSDAVTPSVFSVVAIGTTTAGDRTMRAPGDAVGVAAPIDADTARRNLAGRSARRRGVRLPGRWRDLTLTYTVRATDDSTAFDDQTVTITITGTNDAPVITVVGTTATPRRLARPIWR